MVDRRRLSLLALVLLAAALHTSGIARTILPAQDGLKFIRVARQFRDGHTADVVRGSDRHPLYPALIALAEPCVAPFAGRGPDAWRIAAQVVSTVASVALLFPLFGLTRRMFDDRIAAMAVFGLVVLPSPMEVGHDTLSDSLGLLATLAALRLGASAMETGDRRAFVGCGLAAGLGFLARPEVALVPIAVGLATFVDLARRGRLSEVVASRPAALRLSTLGVAFLALVGGYALVKGEVSEKLSLRYGAGLVAKPPAPARKAARWLPPGLDDPRWDFSPKEDGAPEKAPGRPDARAAFVRLLSRWAAGPEGFAGLLALWGVVVGRSVRARIARDRGDPDDVGDRTATLRTLLTVYILLFALVLVRHVAALGYLSDRHLLPMLAVALPWGAAGLDDLASRVAGALGWSPGRSRRIGATLVVLTALAAFALPYARPGHRSRWGHRAAGDWLKEHAGPGEAVLDTRGWSAFVADRPCYDYWHVRQALTDDRLAYVVVGEDELKSGSRRAATLRALLAYSSTPAAAFSEEEGGRGVGVRVFRYRRPDSWEGLHP